MKSPLRTMTQAQRLVRAGRPLSALLALQKLVAPPLSTKKPKAPPRPVKAYGASSAPPTRPPPCSFVRGRFTTPHGTLSFKLYTPRGSARRRMPLVVMLHGCGQSADAFAIGTSMNKLADELGFLVLYPEQWVTANLGS